MKKVVICAVCSALCISCLFSGCIKSTSVENDTTSLARQEFLSNIDSFKLFLQNNVTDIDNIAHKGLAMALNEISISVSDVAKEETLVEPVVLDDLTMLFDEAGFNTYAEMYTLCRGYSYAGDKQLILKMQFSLSDDMFSVLSCVRTLVQPEILNTETSSDVTSSGSAGDIGFEPPNNDPWIPPSTGGEVADPWVSNIPDYTFSESVESTVSEPAESVSKSDTSEETPTDTSNTSESAETQIDVSDISGSSEISSESRKPVASSTMEVTNID